jgi:hypothetical protein
MRIAEGKTTRFGLRGDGVCGEMRNFSPQHWSGSTRGSRFKSTFGFLYASQLNSLVIAVITRIKKPKLEVLPSKSETQVSVIYIFS